MNEVGDPQCIKCIWLLSNADVVYPGTCNFYSSRLHRWLYRLQHCSFSVFLFFKFWMSPVKKCQWCYCSIIEDWTLHGRQLGRDYNNACVVGVDSSHSTSDEITIIQKQRRMGKEGNGHNERKSATCFVTVLSCSAKPYFSHCQSTIGIYCANLEAINVPNYHSSWKQTCFCNCPLPPLHSYWGPLVLTLVIQDRPGFPHRMCDVGTMRYNVNLFSL